MTRLVVGSAVYGLQKESEFQHCLFLLQHFAWDQLLNVLSFVTGFCETENSPKCIELCRDRKKKSVWLFPGHCQSS